VLFLEKQELKEHNRIKTEYEDENEYDNQFTVLYTAACIFSTGVNKDTAFWHESENKAISIDKYASAGG
jgi:hypothetical protein